MNYTAQIRVLLILTMLLSAAAGFCHAGPLEDGDAYLKDKRASEAEAAYTQALATTPDSVKALIGRGRARQALGNKEGAAADFDRAVKLAPTNGEALGYRANFRELAMNDYKGAIEDYNRYIVLHPKSSTAYLDRGRTLQKAGSLSDALADLDKSVALKADVSAAHAVRGLVLEKMGRNAEAFESYQKALELKPDNPLAKKGVELMSARLAGKSDASGSSNPPGGGAGSVAKTGKPADLAAGKTNPPAGTPDKEAGKGVTKEPGKQVAVETRTAATPTPSVLKRRIFRLSKTEIPNEDKIWGMEKSNGCRVGYEGQGTKAGFNVSWDLNGKTSTRRIRWSVPEEIIPGQAAKFRIESSISGDQVASAYIEFDPHWWRIQGLSNRILTGTRTLPGRLDWRHVPDVPSGEYDLVLPPEIGQAPEECLAGRGDRELVIRYPGAETGSLFFNSPGDNFSPKLPKDIPIEETRHPMKYWVHPGAKELGRLTVTVFLDDSRYPLAVYEYRCFEDVMEDGIEFQTEPAGRAVLRADGRDGVLLKARAKARPDEPAPTPEATQNIAFSGIGDGAAWVDLSKSEMRNGWKVVQIRASNPDTVRGPWTPPATLTVRAETRDKDRLLAGDFALTVPPAPTIDADPDIVEVIAKSRETAKVKVRLENGGEGLWKFRTEYAQKNRPLAVAEVDPTEGQTTTLTLKEAGLDPKPGGSSNEVSVLRIIAEQKDRDPVERDIKIIAGQEGVFATTVGRDPDGGFYRVAANGSGKSTDVDFRVFLVDPVTKKLVNDKDAVGKLKIECLEPESGVAIQALKAGKVKSFFAGIRAGNDPTGIYRFSLAKEIPGDGRIISCDFKATYPGRDEENFTAIFSLGFVTSSNGPGSADWQVELDRCQEVINKFVPPAYLARMQAILDKRKRTLGAEGLHLLREKIWQSAVELTLGEGGMGYANEAAWADHITVTLEWTEWAGNMAFGAVIGATTGPYGATGASMLKTAVISALNAYQDGKGADEWLWENLCTIPGIIEGKAIDPGTFEQMGMESKAKAWAIYIGYHFCKNLYNGATVIEALKNTAREAGSNVLSGWLTEQVKMSMAKGPAVAEGKPASDEEAPARAGALPTTGEANAVQRIRSRMSIRGGKPYASAEDVIAIMGDPSMVRAIKGGPPEIQRAFSNTREAIYRQHDGDLVSFVKENVPDMKYRMVKVMEFRTPGQDGASLNTDRDYRVCYYAGRDRGTGKERWIEVDRRMWQDHSYEAFARATGGPTDSPEAAKDWAEGLQQRATDKYDAEASPDFSDQAKVWNSQSGKFENAQIIPSIVRVKAGQPGSRLKDPQALGHMYQMKVGDARFKHEAFVQAQKAVKELDGVMTGYLKQKRNVGVLPPSIVEGMNAVLVVNKKLAADPNRRDPVAIAEAEMKLRESGFANLNDFMNKLSGQFESLKNVKE